MRALHILAVAATACALWTAPALAHPGGLDAAGCHTDRRTGTRHCHGAGGQSRPSVTPRAPVTGRAFRNCAEARAAGAAPVRRGQPGYGPHLDRDNDGIGCER